MLALPTVPVMSVVPSSTRCHPLSLTAKSLRVCGLLPCNTVTKSSIANPAGNESTEVHAVLRISYINTLLFVVDDHVGTER